MQYIAHSKFSWNHKNLTHSSFYQTIYGFSSQANSVFNKLSLFGIAPVSLSRHRPKRSFDHVMQNRVFLVSLTIVFRMSLSSFATCSFVAFFSFTWQCWYSAFFSCSYCLAVNIYRAWIMFLSYLHSYKCQRKDSVNS